MPPRSKKFSQVAGSKIAQQNSSLLNLPAELRNRIYELTFENAVAENGRICHGYRHSSRPTLPSAPGLLAACKQTHAEALKIYYSTVIFESEDARHLEYKCTAIGSIREKWIRHVNLRVPPRRCHREPGRWRHWGYQWGSGNYLTAEMMRKEDLRTMAANAEWQLELIEEKTFVPRVYVLVALRLGPAYEALSAAPEEDVQAFIEYKDARDGGADVRQREGERPWLAEWFEHGSFDW